MFGNPESRLARIALTTLLITSAVASAQTASETTTRAPPPALSKPASADPSTNPWNTGTRLRKPPAESTTPADSTLNLTVYPRLHDDAGPPGHRPGYRPGSGHRTPAYATDVTAIVTHCADGRRVITALVIGGQSTPLDNRCDQTIRNPGPSRTTCDANTWNCR